MQEPRSIFLLSGGGGGGAANALEGGGLETLLLESLNRFGNIVGSESHARSAALGLKRNDVVSIIPSFPVLKIPLFPSDSIRGKNTLFQRNIAAYSKRNIASVIPKTRVIIPLFHRLLLFSSRCCVHASHSIFPS